MSNIRVEFRPKISAEISVNLAEISVSAETDFGRFGRSLSFGLLGNLDSLSDNC